MTRPNWSRWRGFASTGLSAALHAPAVGHAHPRRVHRAPVEVEADDVAVGEREPVVLQRLEHLDALPAREGEVAQVALGGQRRVPVVDVVRRLQVEPRGVVEHEHATAGDPDGRPHVVVAPAPELALRVEEPEPERLVLPPVIRLGIVEVVVVEEGLVALAELGLFGKHRHACTPFVRRVRSVTSWSSRLSRISPCVPHSRSPFGNANDASPPATSRPVRRRHCRRRSDRGRAPVPAVRSRSWRRRMKHESGSVTTSDTSRGSGASSTAPSITPTNTSITNPVTIGPCVSSWPTISTRAAGYRAPRRPRGARHRPTRRRCRGRPVRPGTPSRHGGAPSSPAAS